MLTLCDQVSADSSALDPVLAVRRRAELADLFPAAVPEPGMAGRKDSALYVV